ncbi:MAG: sensor histidine kinase [Candidatus Kapabacteria bacterium]|nr:sensor histidine kinase [Candidatus Kapabacteria bacterium]
MAETGTIPLKRTREPLPPINDIPLRVVFTPLIAYAVPQMSGMMDFASSSWMKIFLEFPYFLLVSFVIWQGNVMILRRIDVRFSWIHTPYKKLLYLFTSYTLYTITCSVMLLSLWYWLHGAEPDKHSIIVATVISVISVIFISHVYETAILIKQRVVDRVRSEKLMRSKVEAELEALKNQIDPHFMFNSLNTLSHLIETDTESALLFNNSLAEVYRYILSYKGKTLVPLKEELEFVKNYFALLQLRFGCGLQLDIDVPQHQVEKYLVPPISLQVLIENAVKHNEFSDTKPMVIVIRLLQNSVVVKNTKRTKTSNRHSGRIGLTNLNERYNLIVGKSIVINDVATFFTVTVPILPTTRYGAYLQHIPLFRADSEFDW